MPVAGRLAREVNLVDYADQGNPVVADRYYNPVEQKAVGADMTDGNERFAGVVKFFNPDKGYGFIRRDGGQDVFVHANELRRSGITDLTPITTGAKLEFAVEIIDNKGPKAVSIVLVALAEPVPPVQTSTASQAAATNGV